MRAIITPATTQTTVAALSTANRCEAVRLRRSRYQADGRSPIRVLDRAWRMKRQSTETRVRLSGNAAVSAKSAVKARGRSIWPSTPPRISPGQYEIKMISQPITMGVATSMAARLTTRLRSEKSKLRPRPSWLLESLKRTLSTMTTAPSTISPKSSAPRLIKLPDIPSQESAQRANRNAAGITKMVIKVARQLRKKNSRTAVTRDIAKERFTAIVCETPLTISARLYKDRISTSAGRYF